MKLRTLLYLILFALAGYHAYDYIVTQYNQPAIAYKRYAKALLKGDSAQSKNLTSGNDALTPFLAQQTRQEWLNGTPRFTWYTFLSRNDSPDGNMVTFVVKQSVRVDPPGTSSLIGSEVRNDRHIVTLVKDKSTWKIQRFEDGPTQAYNSSRINQR